MKRLLFILLMFPMVAFQLECEAQSASPGASFPSLSDWFLSTGKWEGDPQIYVKEFGSGTDTVIMLHGGWGGDYEGLLGAVAALKDEYRFIFYDQRGSLRSPFPDSLITFDAHIEDLERLRNELKLRQLTVVGHSMGAVLACAYAAKYPQRIRRLVLLSPAPLKNPIPEKDMVASNQQALLQAFVQRKEIGVEFDKYNLRRKSPALTSKEETAKFRILFAGRMLYDLSKWPLLTGGRALFKAHVFQLTENTYPKEGWDYYQEFQKQQYPVRIVIGDYDFLDLGNNMNKAWSAGISNVELTTIGKAGHFVWIDQPELFTMKLRRSLEK